MKTSRQNPTGVESFDHSELARFPEYAAAKEAMNALVHAMDRADVDMSQERWLGVVAEMAACLPYPDFCRPCRNRGNYGDMYWPYAATVTGGMLRGRYRCHRCDAEWTCNYAVDLPLYLD